MKFEKVNVGEVKVGDKAILQRSGEYNLSTVSKVDNPKLGNTVGLKDENGVFYLYLDSAFVYRVIEKEILEVHWFDLKVGDTIHNSDLGMVDLTVESLGHSYLNYVTENGRCGRDSLSELKRDGYTGSDLKFNVVRKVSYDIQTRIC